MLTILLTFEFNRGIWQYIYLQLVIVNSCLNSGAKKFWVVSFLHSYLVLQHYQTVSRLCVAIWHTHLVMETPKCISYKPFETHNLLSELFLKLLKRVKHATTNCPLSSSSSSSSNNLHQNWQACSPLLWHKTSPFSPELGVSWYRGIFFILYYILFCSLETQLSSWPVKRVMRRWWDYYYSQEHRTCQIRWEYFTTHRTESGVSDV